MQDLIEYCTTARQIQILKAVDEHGSQNAAAKALNIGQKQVWETIKLMKDRAALRGYAPEHDMTHTTPEGMHVHGVSTLYKSTGEVGIQWVKTSVDKQKQEAVARQVVDALKEDLPKYRPVKKPKFKKYAKELANLFVITDYHLGMLAWPEETGDGAWDLERAEQLLLDWFQTAINLSPDAEVAVFAQLGDFMHWDGFDPLTPASGNLLDADTRWQKLVRTSIRVQRQVIKMLLEAFPKVHVIQADANHDPASGAWMREWMASVYEDEPRITIDNSADSYYCYEHGDVSLFFHHGHKRKPENIDDVFAAKFREVFGRTKHSYAHMGHYHNDKVLETNLMMVEQHRTLAAADAYAAKGGWMSGRDAKVITYHERFGRVSQLVISPELVDAITT